MKADHYTINADLIRIFAILGVVYIHVSDPFLVYPPYLTLRGAFFEILFYINAVFKVSVPLFILLSGYLLLVPSKTDDISAFYTKRLRRVAIPLIFWLMVLFAWQYYLGTSQSAIGILKRLATVDVEHLYFFYVISELYFITPVLMAFISTVGKKGHMLLVGSSIVFTLFVTGLLYVFPDVAINLQTNAMTIFLPFMMYYLLGFFIRKYHVTLSWHYLGWLGFILLSLISWFMANGHFDSYFRHYGGPVLMSMIVLFFMLVMQNNRLSSLKNNRPILGIVQFLASSTFGIFLVHMLIINILSANTFWIPGNIPQPIWLFVFIKTVIVFVLCVTVVHIGKRIPYLRHVFG